MGADLAARLREAIRDVPDFPKPGVLFRDITTLLLRPDLVREAIHALWEPFAAERVTHIAGLEARGFILGTALAVDRHLPLVLMRKPGKLPGARFGEEYRLEYGSAGLEVHRDALGPGDRVLIVDDVLATGGTAAAAGRLAAQCGADVVGYAFLAEIEILEGRRQLGSVPAVSLLLYGAEPISGS
ncbi:MAG: adenine phosphoribosyltransferase [Candidatus Eisenbacteria bacterium]|nr:adenine phosphoribosyltransferase [Candidatus Latescibacterota bacterium]MBD3301244.1 adenine phosphoribosyltransferase [Candidatus Eisenbacteria bacterium]